MSNTIYLEKIEELKLAQKYSEARDLIEKYLKNNQDDYKMFEELADVYLHEDKLEEAKHAVEYAQELSPKSPTGLYLLGYVLLQEKAFSQAIEYFNQSNSIQSNNPEVLRNLGWAYCMNNEHQKGIIVLKRALNLAPDDILIKEDLGMAYLQIGDKKKATYYLDSKNVTHVFSSESLD